MNSTPWWAAAPIVLFLFNIGLAALTIFGFIFLLVKVASIDRTLKEIAHKLDKQV